LRLSKYNLLAICFTLALTATAADAQTGLDGYFGVGTAQVGSSGGSIDTFGTGTPFSTPGMHGTFGKAGGDFMVTPHLGIGAEMDFRFSQGAYAGLTYRPMFYDVNAIYTPVKSTRRVVPEFQGGLGGVNLKFYYPSQYCNAFTGCSSNNTYLQSSNHFQVHMGAGVRFYVTPHLFVKPQVDAHYVNNFFQFGSNWVPQYTASLGWSFGRRE
jgi:outer membrane protein W